MRLLDTLPESVYRVSDVIVVLTTRNGRQWQLDVIKTLLDEVGAIMLYFLDE